MGVHPDIVAKISVMPAELTLRQAPLRDDILGYFECRIVIPSGTWDCHVSFPEAGGRVELGTLAIAHIELQESQEVLLGLYPGDSFELKELDVIAIGTVTELVSVPVANEMRLEFTGTSREYFKIWAVNLCLTLLTLGIFSAWAKVRKKRYLYSHTILDGTPFQYLGQPLPILKGRLVAAALFAAYYVSRHFLVGALPYIFAVGVVLAPWVIVRSSAFNARYSAYRNMTFRFDGNYREALGVISGWGVVPALVTGMIFNWWSVSWLQGVLVGVACLVYPWWIARLTRFVIGHTEYGGQNGSLSATGWHFFKIYFVAFIVFCIVAFCGVGAVSELSPKKYLLLSLPIYLAYACAYAYMKARSGNLVWNRTAVGPLRFRSTLRGWILAQYYLTNAVAIAASGGLLIPWAAMRTMKYRADNLGVFIAGELTEFDGSEAGAVGAAGAEIGELFEMDLSI